MGAGKRQGRLEIRGGTIRPGATVRTRCTVGPIPAETHARVKQVVRTGGGADDLRVLIVTGEERAWCDGREIRKLYD